jgi:hypothetical protein
MLSKHETGVARGTEQKLLSHQNHAHVVAGALADPLYSSSVWLCQWLPSPNWISFFPQNNLLLACFVTFLQLTTFVAFVLSALRSDDLSA